MILTHLQFVLILINGSKLFTKLNNTDFDFADYNNDGLSDVVISGEDPSDGMQLQNYM
jgi:hypothetical protein